MMKYKQVRCASTNDYAMQHIEGLAHNTVVWAKNQSGGKGRNGRQFVSTPGGVYMSLVRRDNKSLAQCGDYVMAAALAVQRALGELGLPAHIKWPNDVWIGEKKIAGILIETKWLDDKVAVAVLGIGVNVNNDVSAVDRPVTSVKLETGRRGSTRRLMRKIAENVDELLSWPTAELAAEWKKDMLTLGRTVRLPDGGEGKAVDVTEEGHLLVETPNGLREIGVGDVELAEV